MARKADKFSLSGQSVLVTGAAGCIGAWVVKILREIGATPIIYDLSETRHRMDLIMEDTSDLVWVRGDVTDYKQLSRTLRNHDVTAIIHLAALQVPFAKADPIKGTAVNVMGTTHILEAARQLGISRVAFASSIAAPAMTNPNHLDTLYGAHKVCNEQMARVYWQDWQMPSVCIRPGVIYGPGRDQGMSAAPTLALLAACFDYPYTIPFSGPVAYVYAEDAAMRFVAAISRDNEGAHVFNMNGHVVDMQDVADTITRLCPDHRVGMEGDALPFPAKTDDGGLDTYLGAPPHRSFAAGLADTRTVFVAAHAAGLLDGPEIERMLGIAS